LIQLPFVKIDHSLLQKHYDKNIHKKIGDKDIICEIIFISEGDKGRKKGS